MSEPKQQPKILLRRPKKSERSPSGVSQSIDPAPPLSKGDGAGGARSVSTASNTSPPVPPGPKQPIWYRFRTALTTLLVLNAVVVGYTLFRTSSKPSEVSEEAQSVEETATEKEKVEEKPKELEIEKEKAESVDIKRVVPEPSEVTHAVVIPEAISLEGISKPEVLSEDQQELFKWILAEKRKVKPTSKAEKAQIDAEKALLKEFLRTKSVLKFGGGV
eukprot:c12296_g1_i1 orf=432-1085(-)